MIKYRKILQSRRITFALTLLVLVPLFIAFTGLLNPKVKASWISPDWQYRQVVSIDAHATSENNVYVILPDFDATDLTKFQPDCGDLRFTKFTGEELQYYVVECSTNSEIHVQFDTLPSGTFRFYMYYGNSSADNGFEVSDFTTEATGLGTIQYLNEEYRAKPYAHFKYDEGSGDTVADSSSSFNGVLGSTSSPESIDPTWRDSTDCISGTCLEFDGANDYVSGFDNGTDFSYIQNTAVFTVSTFVKFDNHSANTFQALMGNTPIRTAIKGFLLLWENRSGIGTKQLRCLATRGVDAAYTFTISSPINVITDNEFHQITCTGDGSVVRLYVDGELVASGAVQTLSSGPAAVPINIGRTNDTGGFYGYFDGLMDETVFYNRSATEQEILDNYYYWMEFSPPTGSYVGYSTKPSLPIPLIHYKLDEQGGQTINNSITSTFSGTFGANTGASTDDPLWHSEDSCRTNACGNFDGTNDYINVGNIGNLGTVYSVSLWAKYVSGGGSTMISYRTDTLTTTSNVAFQIDGSGSDHRFLVRNNAGTIATTTSTGTLNSEWNHIVGVRDGNALTIYVNGVKRHTASASLGAITMNKLTIGGLYLDNINTMETGSHFRGSIDEVKIFAEALTDEQVRLDFNANSALNVGTTANTLGASLLGGNGNAPIAEYRFEENTGTSTNDSSTNSSVGTLNNGTTWTSGKVGSAVLLDGIDDNVTFPSSTPLNLGASDFTIEAYVKGNNLENSDIIVGKTAGGACSATYGYSLGIFDSLYPTLHFCTAAGSHAKIQGTQALSNNQWYHIAVVVDRDSTANTRMYVNGIQATTTVANLATHTGSITNTEVLAVGSESDNEFNWSGEIDQVRIYNYVRSQTQIMYNFNKGAPVGWWKFDQTSGTVAYDSSEFQSNGTLVSMDPATDWITDGSCPFDNNCLDFDGVNDTVTIPYSTRYDPGNSFSVGAWVYPRTYATCVHPDYADFVISKGNDTVAGAFYISICTGGTSTFVVRSNSAGHSAPAAAGSVPLNQWTHLFGTFDGTTLRFYVNGVLRATTNTGAVTVPAYNALVRIGSNSTPTFPYYFNGKIDDVRIYKYPLSAAQVQQVYNNGAALLYE